MAVQRPSLPQTLATAVALALVVGCIPRPTTALALPAGAPGPTTVGARAIVLTLLIVSDTAANVGKVAEIVRRLDEELGPHEVHVIRLQYADASYLAGILNHVFVGAGFARAPMIVADPRTNSLVIRARRPDLDAIGRLLDHTQ